MTGHFGGAKLQGPKGLEERSQPLWAGAAVTGTWLRLKGLGRPVMEGPEPRSPEGFSPNRKVLFDVMPSLYLRHRQCFQSLEALCLDSQHRKGQSFGCALPAASSRRLQSGQQSPVFVALVAAEATKEGTMPLPLVPCPQHS